MKITKKEIKAMGPCPNGWKWYLGHKISDLRELLLTVNSSDDSGGEGPEWAWWLLRNLLRDKKEISVKISIFSARLVLDNYEREYPNDRRIRETIDAAQNWVDDPTEENRIAAAKSAESSWAVSESARSPESYWSARCAAESSWAASESSRTGRTRRTGRAAAEAYWSARSSAESAAESVRSVRSARSSAESVLAAKKEIQEKILNYAVDLLEETNV